VGAGASVRASCSSLARRSITILMHASPTVTSLRSTVSAYSNGTLRNSMSAASLRSGTLRSSASTAGLRRPPSASSGFSAARLLSADNCRLAGDAFVLARPKWTDTHTEHTWHGRRQAIAPRLVPSKSQASFSVKAWRQGYLKPSGLDTTADKTVTQFVDAHPTQEQLRYARVGYRRMAIAWDDYVQAENMRALTAMRRGEARRRRAESVLQ